METDWTVDESLGVAVREVGGVLYVRATGLGGADRIVASIKRIIPEMPDGGVAQVCFMAFQPDGLAIHPANRLAFARAMGQSFHPLGNAWSPEAFAVVRGTGNYGAASALSPIAAPLDCSDWPEAFDAARERNKPVKVRVGAEVGTCFPSGYFKPSPIAEPETGTVTT